jgi:hypothetical protein
LCGVSPACATCQGTCASFRPLAQGGSTCTTDHFGILAANIDYVKFGATVQALTPALDTPIELLAATSNDVTIREI